MQLSREKVEAALAASGSKGKGQKWQCPVPEHTDRNASFSYIEHSDSHITVKCFAGCDYTAILNALGLEKRDLYPVAPEPTYGRPTRIVTGPRHPDATYRYTDERGELLYEKLRSNALDYGTTGIKTMKQRRPNARGGWSYELGDVRRVIYHLTDVLGAIVCDDWVLWVEGEKAADRLKLLGFTATCSGGAESWRPEFAEYLRGAIVAVFPDNDDAGRRHAIDVARGLLGTARAVAIVELAGLPDKGDVCDWLDSLPDVERAGWALEQVIDDAREILPRDLPLQAVA